MPRAAGRAAGLVLGLKIGGVNSPSAFSPPAGKCPDKPLQQAISTSRYTAEDMPVATADKALTARQTRFAAAVARGEPKAKAHRENYAVNPGYEETAQRKALELAKKPHVAAEIRRLTWLSCPAAEDTKGMHEQGIRVLSDLSRTAKSEEVRFKSAMALVHIAQTTIKAADPRATDDEQSRLLDSLRQLYNRVQTATARGTAPDLKLDNCDDEPIDIQALAVVTEPSDK